MAWRESKQMIELKMVQFVLRGVTEGAGLNLDLFFPNKPGHQRWRFC